MGAGDAAPRRGAHRRKRPRRALPGLMLHQDGSSHEWVPGRWRDLIVDHGRCDQRYLLGLLLAEEGTMSSFQGVSECDPGQGPVRSLYADRASHYWNTAGGDPGRTRPRVELLARGNGALGACSAPCRSASPGAQARRVHRHGRGQPLPQGGLPATTQRPLRDPGHGGPPAPPSSPARSTTSCASTRNALPPTTTRCAAWHFCDPRRPPPPVRQGQGPVDEYPDGTMAVFHGPRCLARTPMANLSTASASRGRVTRFDATDRRPVDSVEIPYIQERSTHMVHKPVLRMFSDSILEPLRRVD